MRHELTSPVFNLKPGHACHMIDVGCYESGANRQGMRRNRGIAIFDPHATSLQRRFDAAVPLADGVGPFRSWEFRRDEIKPGLQRAPALGMG